MQSPARPDLRHGGAGYANVAADGGEGRGKQPGARRGREGLWAPPERDGGVEVVRVDAAVNVGAHEAELAGRPQQVTQALGESKVIVGPGSVAGTRVRSQSTSSNGRSGRSVAMVSARRRVRCLCISR
jgi:hypothetical protein